MPKFVFRSNDTIGQAGAEQDNYYLSQCFVDTGTLNILRDCDDARCIIVGRTGSGKSAVLQQLAESEEHVIFIRLEALSLAYISNSNVLNFFDQAGVDLDLFYRWLWKHIFCEAILKARFYDGDELKRKGFLASIVDTVARPRSHEVAIEYLREWCAGEVFWKETETIIKEITKTVENELKGSVDGKVPGIGSLSGSAGRKLTEEQKEDVVNRATEVVVNKAQMRQLSKGPSASKLIVLTQRIMRGNCQLISVRALR